MIYRFFLYFNFLLFCLNNKIILWYRIISNTSLSFLLVTMLFKFNGLKNWCNHKILTFFAFSGYHIQISNFRFLGLYNCLFLSSYHILCYCDLYPLCSFVNDEMIGAQFFHNFNKFRYRQVIGRMSFRWFCKLWDFVIHVINLSIKACLLLLIVLYPLINIVNFLS